MVETKQRMRERGVSFVPAVLRLANLFEGRLLIGLNIADNDAVFHGDGVVIDSGCEMRLDQNVMQNAVLAISLQFVLKGLGGQRLNRNIDRSLPLARNRTQHSGRGNVTKLRLQVRKHAVIWRDSTAPDRCCCPRSRRTGGLPWSGWPCQCPRRSALRTSPRSQPAPSPGEQNKKPTETKHNNCITT